MPKNTRKLPISASVRIPNTRVSRLVCTHGLHKQTHTHTRSRSEKQALVSNRTEKKSRGIKLDVHVLHRIS